MFPHEGALGSNMKRILWITGARELLTEDLNYGLDYGSVRIVNPFRSSQ